MSADPAALPSLPRDQQLADPEQLHRPEHIFVDPLHLLAHAFMHGRLDDFILLRQYLSEGQFCEAPPGISDARSWCYWRLVLDLPEAPLPERFGPHSHSMVAGGLPEMS